MFMTLLLMLLLIWIPRFPWNAAPIFSNYEIFKSLPSTEDAEIPYWDYWGDPLLIVMALTICTGIGFCIVWSICIVIQEKKANHPEDGTQTGPSAETADQAVPSECDQPVRESRRKSNVGPRLDREKTKSRRKKKKRKRKKGR